MSEILCSRCNHPIRPAARFCGFCGAPIADAAAAGSEGITAVGPPETEPELSLERSGERSSALLQVVCSRCGKPLRVGAGFCTACGQPLKRADVSPVPAQPDLPLVTMESQLDQLPIQPETISEPPFVSAPESPEIAAVSAAALPPRRIRLSYRARHTALIALMVLCLGFALAGAYVKDLNQPAATPPPTPQVTAPADIFWIPPVASPEQRKIQVRMADNGRFGLTAGIDGLPQDVQGKKLTYDTTGITNNTRVWIDGETPIFGEKDLAQYLSVAKGDSPLVWEWQKGGIRVTQTLQYVMSNPEVGDTLRIEYRLDNLDTVSHQVGLRMVIDTLIGNNDGVPFLIPGQKGLTTSAVDLRDITIPDSIKALENEDLVKPGVIVNLLLKGGEATPPDRVLITGWLSENMQWDYLESVGGVGAPLRRAGKPDGKPDSAVGLFFNPQPLAPGQSRIIVAYYGLGNISSTASGNKKLGLAAATTRVRQGETFYLSAIVAAPGGQETVRVELPDELRLVEGEAVEKPIAGGPDQAFTQVSWQLITCKPTSNTQIKVILQPGDVTETWSLTIDPVSLTRPVGGCS